MVGENWDVFTKQVLVEKHIVDIMCDNPRGYGPPCPPLPTPMLHIHYLSTLTPSSMMVQNKPKKRPFRDQVTLRTRPSLRQSTSFSTPLTAFNEGCFYTFST